ncbi:HipA N-terminal domain protein [Xylanimonas cellulosilytica DSM 15894]|uniref:HipA N-terminal domain protein n=1 Tax=Xylanimonas cellulosilytica (strain DSM 15894 / JCM 12276 / CECT 5975 / KCTC 9989 / LMG 20990 / NBRC 107835 / XIL07) TaxID=446471 RepID=D1BST4_XYLCX|nr:type II toxin-antitoxin system HipA family toxin [Xylanimonas cellulosilytica]ACZ30776.1 HipA N-terminal domain protein [Xylanimonas cellulosilytica DSM 15894]
MPDRLDVWVDGTHAGTLERTGDRIAFTYTAAYQHLRSAPSLSVSMPRHVARHDDAAAPWIDNLLPDSDAVRARWAARFGERRPTAFGLLRHMGADCAGAVQILPEGTIPDDAGGAEPVTEAEIAAHLRELRRDDSSWAFEQHGGRFSLGGQQGKFALTRTAEGEWHQPTGRTASTHIFKIGIGGLPHSDAAELVTMRTARTLGLAVAGAEVAWFEDQAAIVVERFDRVTRADRIHRLHQEDLCQALGLWRASKYESDGGPGVRELADLTVAVTSPRDLTQSRTDLGRAVTFNWVSAGTHAHAKNYALLHSGARTVLAPQYDLLSTALLWRPHEVRHTARLAMRLGGEYRLRAIRRRHLERAADDLGVEPDWLVDVAYAQATAFVDAVSDQVAAHRDLIDAATAQTFVDGAAQRAADVLRTLDATGPTADSPGPSPDRGVWIPPHTRGGRVVPGHWRTRPGR